MSFEGYYELLCENGHYNSCDIYFISDKCGFCGEKFVWWNIVNQTNCEGEPTDLEVLHKERAEECPTCGHIDLIEPTRYKVPENVGHKGGITFPWED